MRAPARARGQEAYGWRPLAAAARARWLRLSANSFGRDLAFLLALKVVLLVALWVFLVRPAMRPRQDPAATAAALAGVQSSASHELQP